MSTAAQQHRSDDGIAVWRCVQVYNELVFDLLQDPAAARPLTIHETVEDGVYVEGVAEFVVANAADCLGIVSRGQANRCSGAVAQGALSLCLGFQCDTRRRRVSVAGRSGRRT
jgi:hypothetical protein